MVGAPELRRGAPIDATPVVQKRERGGSEPALRHAPRALRPPQRVSNQPAVFPSFRSRAGPARLAWLLTISATHARAAASKVGGCYRSPRSGWAVLDFRCERRTGRFDLPPPLTSTINDIVICGSHGLLADTWDSAAILCWCSNTRSRCARDLERSCTPFSTTASHVR